ncbi:hypothetical protein C475_16933 [Halosimplex carlsbadense 2-9-1]|uniref:Uncharacterized protein n=1 Tax=Halosimplex carlsbadense 2-9-1 TaxID=797114 RepID=M0CIM1_9EURY|nr:hypothetical protein [Halosimplex carlsbadense]ELZ22217.1 hypothetical protein C475_16933 [Halosimplex carlsbadense 2-9-1]
MTDPSVVVARTALRQTYRRIRESRRMTAFFLLIPGFFALQVSGLVGPGAYDLGRRFAAGEVAPVVTEVRRVALSGVVLLVLMGTLGAAGGNSEFKDRYVTFLTATSTRAVAVGSVARQTAVWTALFWPVALAGAVGFALGAEAPVAAVSLVGGSLWLFVVAGVATAPVGFGARWLLDGYGLSKNARFGLGVGMLGLFYLVLFTRQAVGAALDATPLSWAGDLLLLTVPDAGASPALAVGFLLSSLGLVLASLVASVRLAGAVWYDDRALADDGEDADGAPATATPVRDVLASVVPRPTAALVETTWRRTKRTPKTLWYVYPAVFVGLVMAEQLVYSGPFSAAMYAPVVAFTGALAAGSGFTLNPLGTEGDALPGLLTAGVSSETFVRAKAYAVVLPAMPLLVGAALGTAIGAGVGSALVVAAVGVFAVSIAVLAPLCSLALGVHYPPGDEGLLGEDVQIPNKSASAAYTLGMVVVGAPGFGALGAYALPGAIGSATVVAGVGLTVVLAAVVSWLSYRHAVAKVDAYSVE